MSILVPIIGFEQESDLGGKGGGVEEGRRGFQSSGKLTISMGNYRS